VKNVSHVLIPALRLLSSGHMNHHQPHLKKLNDQDFPAVYVDDKDDDIDWFSLSTVVASLLASQYSKAFRLIMTYVVQRQNAHSTTS